MAPLTALQFLREQLCGMPPMVEADLTDKTAIVVGANAGLGFEAAKHFANMNPGRLILACRNQQKGEAALSDIKSSTGFARIELWIIDLADFASVKAFADKFDQDGGRLDILVENAGMITTDDRFVTTKDGWLTILQTNCIAPALLALRLLPHMWRTTEEYSTTPRLVVTSSDTHYWSTLHKNPVVSKSSNVLKAISSAEYFTKTPLQNQYFDSKLLNVLFVRDLQQRLLQPEITINAVQPGYCHSQLRTDLGGVERLFDRMAEKAIAYTSEEGSRQLIYGAVGGKEEEMRGSYVSYNHITEPSDFVISEEGAKMGDKIWDELMELLPLVGSSKERLTHYLKF